MHLKNGLFIEKYPDGAVGVNDSEDGRNGTYILSDDEWISTIAEVSNGHSDPAAAVVAARNFHLGSPSLSLDKLRAANVQRCEEVFHPLHDWSPTDWATAMAGECGEACNEVKKLRRLDGADSMLDGPSMREHLTTLIGNELADLIIYADLLAARLGIDLSEHITLKFNEVSKKRKSTVYL